MAIEVNTATKKSDYEIIVVNNASTDGTKEFLENTKGRFDNFTVLNQDKNYGVIARNRAFEIAKGSLIVQCDDDVLLQDWWDKVLTYFVNVEIGAIGTEGSLWMGWVNQFNKDIKEGDFVDFLTGQFWIFKNEGWRYDESFGFFWHEESDLQMRMKYEKKYRFVQCDKNVIHHLELRNVCDMDWQLHDKNWNKFVEKWKPLENELNLEGRKKEESCLVGLSRCPSCGAEYKEKVSGCSICGRSFCE
jgi:glycosyltransferase involved in cell wall biosynthesis